MSEFHDPELRQELGRLSGPYPDDNAAFAAWQRRVGQVRRRRAVALTTGGAMSLLVGVVAVAAMQTPGRHSVVPQKASETSAKVTTTVAITHVKPAITESPDAPTTTTTTLAPETTPGTEPAIDTSMPEVDAGLGGGATPADTTHKSQGGTTKPPASATTPTSEESDSHHGTETFHSAGGSITVREDHDRLIVVDITPASGYQGHQTDHFDHQIAVMFTSASHNWEITVKLDHGKISHETHEKGGGHEESGPPTSNGGGSNGGGSGSGGD